jgi:hypothetical protein
LSKAFLTVAINTRHLQPFMKLTLLNPVRFLLNITYIFLIKKRQKATVVYIGRKKQLQGDAIAGWIAHRIQ